ncbi:MAG TPA: CaiB/BaiF CoA-transferase family protein, partial [Acidimicrobiales bacterium]|nr:CaiB/BaiF CoA-transferase family protein [Acidimicrobiales bacterium]
GESTTFLSANRNKRSLAIDLDEPQGADIARRLAAQADVLVESFRPGSLDKRGLGYDRVREHNPGLIYCSISAFGSVGPMAGSPGYDPIVQAYSGIMSMTGEVDRSPVRLGIGAIDLGTGLWATIAIQAALAARREHGRGCHIETSLYETAVWWLSYFITGYLASGNLPRRSGTRTAFIAPYETFPTADGDLMVAAANDNLFRLFVDALDIPEVAADPRFASNPDRVANREALRALIVERTVHRTAAEWEDVLTARTVPCSRIRTVADAVADPQTEALGLLTALPHPLIPDLRMVDMPVSEGGRRAAHRRPPPLLGEHTSEVLAELGFSDDEIATLRDKGIVA